MSLSDADFSVVGGDGPSDFVVKARGEIDIYTGEQLREVLRDVLAESPARVVIDLAEVTFIDSTGLSVIVAAFKRAQDTRTELVFQGAGPNVLRVLELTGLNHLLPLVADPASGKGATAPTS
jgi:anti-sigma B factor antagonist